jgi:hypothetical protein
MTMKPTFEDMVLLYRQWLEFPKCTREDFFQIYNWSQTDFFDECLMRTGNP